MIVHTSVVLTWRDNEVAFTCKHDVMCHWNAINFCNCVTSVKIEVNVKYWCSNGNVTRCECWTIDIDEAVKMNHEEGKNGQSTWHPMQGQVSLSSFANSGEWNEDMITIIALSCNIIDHRSPLPPYTYIFPSGDEIMWNCWICGLCFSCYWRGSSKIECTSDQLFHKFSVNRERRTGVQDLKLGFLCPS